MDDFFLGNVAAVFGGGPVVDEEAGEGAEVVGLVDVGVGVADVGDDDTDFKNFFPLYFKAVANRALTEGGVILKMGE